MLNTDTKKHIDNARDVLVGVAPNPTTQIDQITYALIYKFMDDMDEAAIKAGGKPSFFVEELAPYSWSNLLSPRLGNQEKLNLYRDALSNFSVAKQLPELFRTIFKGAALPYNSPETLGLFLKEISFFDYTHPEELGNAYEYLLSIMSAQGDAGQFRTPRHIIDFMVEVMKPTKDDKILDPTCGTAGFLVSTYNHILAQHDGKDVGDKKEKSLTPDERKKLMQNLQGYDIDPTMVRIAQVNMYLHQFKNPQIFQYDSLTSEERWNEKFDVILANPPFMSPKGGIKPHTKFGVSSNRSEVLFVDYIASHLRPTGRAGIIVPEGIIFQSGRAYVELRKNLIENGLYAVVSLPSGVFQPYSNVKTSILFMNKTISKQLDSISYIKVNNDGFDLGAKKKPIEFNDLPEALNILNKLATGNKVESDLVIHISHQELLEDGDFNLSGDRYRIGADYSNGKWPLMSLGELEEKGELEFVRGQSLSKSELTPDGKYPCIHYGEIYSIYGPVISEVVSKTDSKGKVLSVPGDVLVPATQTADALGMARGCCLNAEGVVIGGDINVIRTRNKVLLGNYLAYAISNFPLKQSLANLAKGVNILHLANKDLRRLALPIPPIAEQIKIIKKVEEHQAGIEKLKNSVVDLEGKIANTILEIWS